MAKTDNKNAADGEKPKEAPLSGRRAVRDKWVKKASKLAPAWYDPHRTLIWHHHGTVIPFVWKRCGFAFISTLVVCFCWDGVRHAKSEKDAEWGDKVLYHLFKDSEDFFRLASGLLTCILGFFNATVYGRWWNVRVICGIVIGRTMDTTVMFSSYIKKGRNVDAVRKDLNRLLALAHKVTYFNTSRRGLDMTELVDEGLVVADSEEAHALQECQSRGVGAYNVVYGWLLSRLYDAQAEFEIEVDDRTWGTFLQSVQTNVTAMRGAAADLIMYINQPIPMGYTHLLECMLEIYLFMATFGLVPRLHWTAPIINVVITIFFYGFYTVALHMFDPFDEDDHFGFDTQKFYRDVLKGSTVIEALVPVPQAALPSTSVMKSPTGPYRGVSTELLEPLASPSCASRQTRKKTLPSAAG